MKISSKFAGTPLKDYETEVTWRRIMNYAASLEDSNPLYFDDERQEGVIGPPMLSVAVTWPVLENIVDYITIKDFPKEVIPHQVHYTEHLIIHRLIRSGDKIKVKGKIAAVLPHRSGTHLIMRLDATDADGKAVFTEFNGGLIRGVECADEGRGGEDIPNTPTYKGSPLPIWESVIPISPMAPFIYDGCTNIFFPIHTSAKFAHAVRLPGIILQGTATLGYAVREIINREAGGNPFQVRSTACRFTGMVFPGTEIRVQLLSRERSNGGTNLFFIVLNSAGGKAISDGYVSLGKN
ncbi:MAG: MaoC family dehydratase N-terminal domain-containing protein [Candidatus Tectomicrobia bacterium]|uniref:MaoC family dehydratase N-terminal domain-containing protein n=1 Tax=Tectimicrobiota bacterium TaxID=2528274 RepID=A0A933GM95_UNCTE|nr:MaoC family dehydratase N-terminal domain-containing protein [Candidatus Tectomicrobia bacterium]